MINRILGFVRYIWHKLRKTKKYHLTIKLKDYLKNEKKFSVLPAKERKSVISFLKYNLIEVFNYPFILKYIYRKVRVYEDENNGLKYVITDDGNVLYFKRGMSKKEIKNLYNSLCAEQDKLSPHNYNFDNVDITTDTIFADIGAAEGIYSLSIVNKIKKLYIFECDQSWIESLEATFHPWKEKVIIENKYVSDKNDQLNVSIEHYFEQREKPTLLKIDVEGAEIDVLNGAISIINSNIKDILVCTYHRNGDAEKISQYLTNRGYHINFSLGYMLFLWEKDAYCIEPPYDFRKGLIHASKIIL